MTDLRAAVDAYLALRRSLGYTLIDAGWLLPDFIDYLHRHSAEHVTIELALAWAILPVNTSPVWWRQRLGAVRGFTEYLRNIDPATQVPPRDLLPAHQQRIAPYLYSDIDLAALMAAARSLNPPLRAATYEIFIGFLSGTPCDWVRRWPWIATISTATGDCCECVVPSAADGWCRCTRPRSTHFTDTPDPWISTSRDRCPPPCSSRPEALD